MAASQSLRRAINEQAERLGFHLVGVTTPDPPAHIEAFQRWLDASLHGEMGYLASDRAIQRRADPLLILPECRSLLVLGIRYPSPSIIFSQSSAPDPPLTGRISSYAWGADYHQILATRLSQLVAFIELQVGRSVPNRWYTDTGPLLERDLAQRAGLGWIGKNTCLIHPRQGSHFFLAEILLGLDLEPDGPFAPDYCGKCTRCLEACPTRCILPDRVIDSRRCISYMTIELKGAIPVDMRPYIGNWIFGCDLCQQACPWNRRISSQEGDPEFNPRPGIPHPELLEEFSLTSQSFQLKFKGNPILRARRRGYLRNAAVVLGNLGDPASVPTLVQVLLNEPELLVRGHAAWALGRIGDRTARKALDSAFLAGQDVYVQKEIQYALEMCG